MTATSAGSGATARRVRVVDVARAAGVAPGTVSKAINGSGTLSAATRERVRAAADRLGFVPDAGARALTMQRTFTVGLLSTDDVGRFSIPVMLGAENALLGGEISALLATARHDPVREQHHLRALVARRVDGIIVVGRRTDPREPLTVPVPVVYALSPSIDQANVSLVPDDRRGMAQLLHHLRSLGCARIAHVGGRADHHSSRVRLESLTDAAEAGEIELVGDPLFGEWSERWGRQAVDLLLRRAGLGAEQGVAARLARSTLPFDGIVFGSDQLARAGCDRLRERGIRVPEDVAVTGYDDWDVMALASRPPLTTVDMQLGLLGIRAAERLIALITGHEPAGGVEFVPPRLVVRQSTISAD